MLAGGDCTRGLHVWKSVGGRGCPRNEYANCSQTVYRCACGVYDYGEPGGPGHRDCFEKGPCDWTCEPEGNREDRETENA